MVDIPLKAKVKCTDGVGGVTTAVIINPVRQEVTHIVVQKMKYLDYLVPLDLVGETTPDTVHLNCTVAELHDMPSFTEAHFVPADTYDEAAYPSGEWMAPYVTSMRASGDPVEEEHVPAGSLAVHRGTDVHATDGHVGVLEEFVVDPESGHLTHFVLRKGHLWGKRDMTIPISAIDHTEYDTVHLNIDKKSIADLPGVTVQRHYRR